MSLEQSAPAAEKADTQEWVLSDHALDAAEKEVAAEPEAEAEPETTETTATPELSEVEKIAAELGWKPKDQWKGDQAGWTPAADFLKGFAKSKERERQKAREAQQARDDLAERMERLERVHEVSRRKDIDALRGEYYEAKKLALKAGDEKLYDDLEAEEAALVRSMSEEVGASQQIQQQVSAIMDDPLATRFLVDNRWILDADDDKAFDYARKIMSYVEQKGGSPVLQFEEAEKALRRAFPEQYFTGAAPANEPPRDEQGRFRKAEADPAPQPRRSPPLVASADRGATGNTTADRIAKLPPEAQRALRSEVARGHKAEDWLDVYEGKV